MVPTRAAAHTAVPLVGLSPATEAPSRESIADVVFAWREEPAEQLVVLLQLTQSSSVIGRGSGAVALLDLGLGDPVRSVSGLPNCSPIRFNAPVRGRQVTPGVDRQPDRPLPKLVGVLR